MLVYAGRSSGRSSGVEHLLPKQNVVGSIPIARSNFQHGRRTIKALIFTQQSA